MSLQEKVETIRNMISDPYPQTDLDAFYSESGSADGSGLEYEASDSELEEFLDRIDDFGVQGLGHLLDKNIGLSKLGDSRVFGRGHVHIELIFEEQESRSEGGYLLTRGYHLKFQNTAELLLVQKIGYILEDGKLEIDEFELRNFYNLITGTRDPSGGDFDFNEMLDDVNLIKIIEDDD